MDRVSDGDRTAGSEALSPWTATGLEPNPEYSFAIYTYSAAGADTANAEELAEKHAPKRVRRLRAERAHGEGASDDSAVLTWNPPSTRNGKHHAATDYAVHGGGVDRGQLPLQGGPLQRRLQLLGRLAVGQVHPRIGRRSRSPASMTRLEPIPGPQAGSAFPGSAASSPLPSSHRELQGGQSLLAAGVKA